MCVLSLNEVHESFLVIGHTSQMFYTGAMEVKPVCPRILSGDIMKYIHTKLLGFYALIHIINLFSYAWPSMKMKN